MLLDVFIAAENKIEGHLIQILKIESSMEIFIEISNSIRTIINLPIAKIKIEGHLIQTLKMKSNMEIFVEILNQIRAITNIPI